uniref:Uncharacterized protein n=1 Tax=Rhizophora mucronata TaxID=61149 RepID=A0A2P2N7Y5_RHIMU
MQQTKSTN